MSLTNATLNISSARDIAEAGIKAQIEEATKLMEHPSVKRAYEHFMLVCKLVQTQSNIKA
jgi:hypothetical protein